jgi:hypothetical protein
MKLLKTALFLCLFGSLAGAQVVLVGVDTWTPVDKPGDNALLVRFLDSTRPSLPPGSVLTSAAPVLPRMAPDLALAAYQRRSGQQGSDLAAYSASTLVRAELPGTAQKGEFELQRHYAAPRTLEFKPVRFSGDGFVKSNVIARLLQSEVERVQKGDNALIAITAANYKFSYKGLSDVDGRQVHVYQVKPHEKRVGLFKGRIYLDATTGSLVRTEGKVVKSPSFFVKNIEFLQDFADFGRFTFPVRLHSEATARIVGQTIVDVINRDFQPVETTVETARAGQ